MGKKKFAKIWRKVIAGYRYHIETGQKVTHKSKLDITPVELIETKILNQIKMNFKNKYGEWALITGATSGIGAELASQIAAKGLNIVLIARKQDELSKSAQSLESRYRVKTLALSADLSKSEDIDKIFETTKSIPIGLLVLAAGIEVNGAFWKTPIEKELQLVQLNIVSTIKLTHRFIPQMVNKKMGGLLLIASLSGHMPNPYFSNYAGSKAFMLNFGASLHGELTPKGVDVTVLSPGLTKTSMVANNGVDWSKTPMKPMEPSAVAEAGINGLGRSLLVVPGSKNKIMAGMAKHMPLSIQAGMNEKMMHKAIDKNKI